jgi:WD40 repeat protein
MMKKLSLFLLTAIVLLVLSPLPSEAQDIENFHEIRRFSQADGNAFGDLLGSLQGSIAWNPDSSQIAMLERDHKVYIWDIENNELIHISDPFEFDSSSGTLIWAQNNSLLLIAKVVIGREEHIGVWDVWSQEMIAELTALGYTRTVTWSGDGTTLASLQFVETSRNHIIHIWDTNTWEERATWEYNYEEIMSSNNPPDPRFSIADIALNIDGSRVAMAQEWYGGGVEVIDTVTGEVVNILEGDAFEVVDYIEWSPIGDQIIGKQGLFRYHGSLVVWDVTTGETLFSPAAALPVVWHPNGILIASQLPFDPSYEPEYIGAFRIVELGGGWFDLTGHEEYVTALAWSPDGTMLASCSADGTVRIWGE